MPNSINQELIDEIIELSKQCDNGLDTKIDTLLHDYNATKKQNSFFLNKWDKHNLSVKKEEQKKDKMLEQQSRLAAMGEMLDTIAHQWKQPLNSVSMLSDMLKDDYVHKLVDYEYIDDYNANIQIQVDHLLNTLKEFRRFFRPMTNNENFTIEESIKSVKVLMKDQLISQNINLYLDIDEHASIYANKNEFKHLFINLINNSIDAFNEKNINERNIYIRSYIKNLNVIIEVEDNANGIPADIIEKVFEPNFTTKSEDRGSGVGLYIASKIISKHNGTIKVHNSKMGAIFTIILNQSHI
jgi:signal transduction histidine kinase